MQLNYIIISIFLQVYSETISFYINQKPIITIYTPDSILNQKQNYHQNYAGNKERYATCTGASWFHNDYLATLNLFGNKITIYNFDIQQKKFNLNQEITNRDGASLYNSENLTVSPNGKFLAVCSDAPNPGINIYELNLENHKLNPTPIFTTKATKLVHNIRFTSDGKYLGYVTFDDYNAINICEVENKNNKFNLKKTYIKKNNFKSMKSKIINFSKDDKFAIIGYSIPVKISQQKDFKTILVSYSFNINDGTLGKEISKIVLPSRCIEDLAFCNNKENFIATDQANNELVIFKFNNQTGIIDKIYNTIKNPDAQLNFPHGITISNNEKFLVVTNYGDDKFNLYEIKEKY